MHYTQKFTTHKAQSTTKHYCYYMKTLILSAVFGIFIVISLHLWLSPYDTYILNGIPEVLTYRLQHYPSHFQAINASVSLISRKTSYNMKTDTYNANYEDIHGLVIANLRYINDGKPHLSLDIVITAFISIFLVIYSPYYVYYIILSSQSVSGYVFKPQHKLTSNDSETYDYFGFSVSLYNDYALIGAYGNDDLGSISGSAYIFERINSKWIESAKLLPNVGATMDFFAAAVSLYNNYALIGAYGDAGTFSGSAYLFEKVNGEWTQTIKFVPDDLYERAYFGYAASVYNEYILIGAPSWDSDTPSGSAYIFEKINGSWTHVITLSPNDTAGEDRFGFSVSVYSSYAIIGADRDDDSGSAYIFERINGSWIQTIKLLPNNGTSGDSFGWTVSISNKYALIGAYGDTDNGVDYIYIFEKIEGIWTETNKLRGEREGDRFGCSVSIYNEYILIGAEYGGDLQSGAAYVFEEINGIWIQSAKIVPDDAVFNDRFGFSVSLHNNNALIGAYYEASQTGAAFILEIYYDFICDAINNCTNGIYKCNDNTDCTILCRSDYACYNASFHCPSNGNCTVEIEDGYHIGRYMTVDASNTISGTLMLYVNSTGMKDPLQYSTVLCPVFDDCVINVNEYGSYLWRALMGSTIVAQETTHSLAIAATGYCALCYAKVYCPLNNCDITIIGQYGLQLEAAQFYVYHDSNGLSIYCESIQDDAGCSTSTNPSQILCRNDVNEICYLIKNNDTAYTCSDNVHCSTTKQPDITTESTSDVNAPTSTLWSLFKTTLGITMTEFLESDTTSKIQTQHSTDDNDTKTSNNIVYITVGVVILLLIVIGVICYYHKNNVGKKRKLQNDLEVIDKSQNKNIKSEQKKNGQKQEESIDSMYDNNPRIIDGTTGYSTKTVIDDVEGDGEQRVNAPIQQKQEKLLAEVEGAVRNNTVTGNIVISQTDEPKVKTTDSDDIDNIYVKGNLDDNDKIQDVDHCHDIKTTTSDKSQNEKQQKTEGDVYYDSHYDEMHKSELIE